jgi:hypothetical protein
MHRGTVNKTYPSRAFLALRLAPVLYFGMGADDERRRAWASRLADLETRMSNWAAMDSFVVTLGLGLGAGAHAAFKGRLPKSCSNLATTLLNHKLGIESPKLPPPFDPYKRITANKVLIIEGPNKVGKTAMFALAIPWWRQNGPFNRSGFVLNGAEASTYSDFEKWRNNQMRGTIAFSGSDIPQALESFKQSQRVRTFLFKFVPFLAKYFPFRRPYIIVDQFEELVKKYPVEALAFANNLTNDQVRNRLAYVFFVVNSSHATKALKNLNQGDRFDVVKILKTADNLPNASDEDSKRFQTSNCNIGLFKETKGVPLDVLPETVKHRIAEWKNTYHLDYAPNGDVSWSKVVELLFKDHLVAEVRKVLVSRKSLINGKLVDDLSDEDVRTMIETLKIVLKDMSKNGIRQAPLTMWVDLFKAQVHEAIAQALAKAVKMALSTPVVELVRMYGGVASY